MPDEPTRSWLDVTGIPHAPAGSEARIVSLVPSLTELLFDLGLGSQVVGRTSFCIHPASEVERVPSVGGTKKINMARLLALRPTHAIVNIDENPKSMAEALSEAGVEVIVTHPNAPRDNLDLFLLLGGLFGRTEAAETLCGRFEEAHARLVDAARCWPERRVLYLIWKAPWMTVSRDTYIARTLELARWRTVPDSAEARYPEVSPELLLRSDVDLVLFPSEPYRFTDADVEQFRTSCADPMPRLVRIDGEAVSWYGSRAIAGLDELHRVADQVADES